MEIIVEFISEILVQLALQLLAELGWRSFMDTIRLRSNSVFSAFGHMLLGLLAGAISLLFSPHLLMTGYPSRIANLILTPVAAGLLMSALGAWRRRRGQFLLRLDRFSYAYVFALAMALVRFSFGT
jgi:hypothetical protein